MNNKEYTESELDEIIELVQIMKEELALSEKHRKRFESLKQDLNNIITNNNSVQSKEEKKVWNASELKPEHNGKIVTTEKEYTSNYGGIISKGEWTICIEYDDDNKCYFECDSGTISKNITGRKDIEFTFVDQE